MWKSKKFIIVLALAIVALVGGTTGAVLAASSDDGTETQREALLSRICEIYEENTGETIDPDQLQTAFDQAREELRQEILEERLTELVEEGEITQDEADELLEWWQSKPNVDLQGLLGFDGGILSGRGHHHWYGDLYCGNSSDDTSDEDTSA